MEPDGVPGPRSPSSVHGPVSLLPSVRQHLPSVVFGAVLPICAYFVVRRHVGSDTVALIVAGCFSAGWVLVQFARQRRVDAVGVMVLLGFALGVTVSTLLGGNTYVLKIKESFLTALIGIACIVTVFTHDRPAFFYLSRYLNAGNDPDKASAYDRLHELPAGRRTFRVLSVVWGLGLLLQASVHMALADVLPTAAFLAVSPVATACVIGSLAGFTALYTRRVRSGSALAAEPVGGFPAPLTSAPDDGRKAGPTGEGSDRHG